MKFIAQIDLSDAVYRKFDVGPKMAYIFMTEEEDFIDEYLHDAGENAVIIQPDGSNDYVEVHNQPTGPTHSAKEFFPVFKEELPQPPYSEDESYNEVVTFLLGHGHLGGYAALFKEKNIPETPRTGFC